MAALLTTHLPIAPVSTISGNQEKTQSFLEGSGQTFSPGTPVTLGATTAGYVGAYSGTPTYGPPGNILGITALRGQNLPSNGSGAAPVFAGYGFPGGQGAVQDVINQPSAYSIYHGAPFITGSTLVWVASQDTIFEVQVDASSGTTYNATTALIGTSVGLTVDANGFWYADLAKVTVGTNAVGVIVSLNPLDFVPGSTTTQQNNGRVRIVFAASVIQVTN
jgi:hypothetical protein